MPGRAREVEVRDLQTAVPDFRDAPQFSLDGAADSGIASRRRQRGGDVRRWVETDRVVATSQPGQGQDGSRTLGDANIQIKEWDPNTPYLKAMKEVPPGQAYDTYLAQRKTFGSSPAFYLDCADYFLRLNQRDLGIRVLTDVAELQLEDARLLRIIAHRLNQLGEREAAIDLFQKILQMRPEEPQSHRDLGLALADRADDKTRDPAQMSLSAVTDYAESLKLLNTVITGDWDRFVGIQVVALMEANRIAAKLKTVPGGAGIELPLDARLLKNLDLDVRVVMTWDTDNTDVDLWVTEPSSEKCAYDHNRTTIGGLLSKDFTDGYGPEEYCLRKLMPGKYVIQANFYGSRQQSLVGPTTVHATVITNFGRPNEKREYLTLRLTDMKQVVDIGSVTLGE
jgi:Ca-activated chloride channel family protein